MYLRSEFDKKYQGINNNDKRIQRKTSVRDARFVRERQPQIHRRQLLRYNRRERRGQVHFPETAFGQDRAVQGRDFRRQGRAYIRARTEPKRIR